jgi:hypothetical protein
VASVGVKATGRPLWNFVLSPAGVLVLSAPMRHPAIASKVIRTSLVVFASN